MKVFKLVYVAFVDFLLTILLVFSFVNAFFSSGHLDLLDNNWVMIPCALATWLLVKIGLFWFKKKYWDDVYLRKDTTEGID